MNLRTLLLIRGGALSCSALMLAACTVVPRYEERGSRPLPPDPAPVVYQPVPAQPPAPPQPVYQPVPQQAPVPALAEFGVVRDVRIVKLVSENTGGGAVLGAVIGAVVGHQFGSGDGRALGTAVGAVGGALVGNAVEEGGRREDEIYRVRVQFDQGSVRDYNFRSIGRLRAGDRVKLEGGQLHRLTNGQ